MRAVLISIKPDWVKKIISREKTIEVRKTIPKLNPPFKCYIYCTKDRKNPLPIEMGKVLSQVDFWENKDAYYGFGKIVGEFICDQIITVDCDSVAPFSKELDRYIDKDTCLSREELLAYTHYLCYGWHISNLQIYENPKSLSDFKQVKYIRGYHKDGETWLERLHNSGRVEVKWLLKAPQSWCYVEEL